MSAQNTIPLLREVIQRGQLPDDEIDILNRAAGDIEFDVDDRIDALDEGAAGKHLDEEHIEQEYHNALQQIQAEQQAIEFDAPTSDELTPAEAEIDSAPNVQELLIDEEIRMILERHMDKAYQEIIKLISHKIS